MENESKFQKLCKRLIVNAVHNLIPEPVTRTILESLLDVIIEEQNNIDEKISRIMEEPYKSGRDYLIDAMAVEDDNRREEWIKLALQKFISASNLETASLMTAKSQFIVGVCYDLLNERKLALNWYEKAYQLAWLLVLKESNSVSDKIVDKSIHYLKIGITIYMFPELFIFSKISGKDIGSLMMKIVRGDKKEEGKVKKEYYDFMMPLSDLLHIRSSKLKILLEGD